MTGPLDAAREEANQGRIGSRAHHRESSELVGRFEESRRTNLASSDLLTAPPSVLALRSQRASVFLSTRPREPRRW